jgi:hypothetical protein
LIWLKNKEDVAMNRFQVALDRYLIVWTEVYVKYFWNELCSCIVSSNWRAEAIGRWATQRKERELTLRWRQVDVAVLVYPGALYVLLNRSSLMLHNQNGVQQSSMVQAQQCALLCLNHWGTWPLPSTDDWLPPAACAIIGPNLSFIVCLQVG